MRGDERCVGSVYEKGTPILRSCSTCLDLRFRPVRTTSSAGVRSVMKSFR
jgi:hypothetical protein